MKFRPTPLAGAYLVDLEPKIDDRGFLARIFCAREFSDHGLETAWVQMNTSYSRAKGTLRGMHYQRPPNAEVKLVRCVRGAVHDVIVDLRADSPTRGQWFATELSAENRTMLYIPKGVAHGFQTLVDDTELMYQHSEFYTPGQEGGLRFDDGTVGIEWPLPPVAVSERDRSFPEFLAIEAVAS